MAASNYRQMPTISVDPLCGPNYKLWSQKMTVAFEEYEVDYILTTDPAIFTAQKLWS
jgi:hypothetical protein